MCWIGMSSIFRRWLCRSRIIQLARCHEKTGEGCDQQPSPYMLPHRASSQMFLLWFHARRLLDEKQQSCSMQTRCTKNNRRRVALFSAESPPMLSDHMEYSMYITYEVTFPSIPCCIIRTITHPNQDAHHG